MLARNLLQTCGVLLTLALSSASAFAQQSWTATETAGAPAKRTVHSAVWTGSEMIVWGGADDGQSPVVFYQSGAHYDPVADTWTFNTGTDSGVPAARGAHVAIWTGKRMVIWGGSSGDETVYATGGIYDPVPRTWADNGTSQTGAPSARMECTGVWTGSKLLIWGGRPASEGSYDNTDTGGAYDPEADSWSTIPGIDDGQLDAPTERYWHSAVWTGREMIVWGGYRHPDYLHHGYAYDPSNSTDPWREISCNGAPVKRWHHTAVWTGSKMAIWGGAGGPSGYNLNTGGLYDPKADSWSTISTTGGDGAPGVRTNHKAVWAEDCMIVWGGHDTYSLQDGGLYFPATDTWTDTTMTNVPDPRHEQSAVWTGKNMIVWGGHRYTASPSVDATLNTGAMFDKYTEVDSWSATSTDFGDWEDCNDDTDPPGRRNHTAVWTGQEMLVWGGYNATNGYLNDGGHYDPVTDTWSMISAPNSNLEGRERHTAVWSGREMIVWGGEKGLGTDSNYLNTGGRYDPILKSWLAVSMTSAPGVRSDHTAVWTGHYMVVWGGGKYSDGRLDDGGRYDPVANSWSSVSSTSDPTERALHTAVWTGSEMIVWGGWTAESDDNSGGRYDPEADSWAATETNGAPTKRWYHRAVWTGSRMCVWGGATGSSNNNTGGLYDPVGNSWSATSTTNAPSSRKIHGMVWTGRHVIVWSGFGGSDTGGRYDPGDNSWESTSTGTNVPVYRYYFTAVWTGKYMVVWGGQNSSGVYFVNGGRYQP